MISGETNPKYVVKGEEVYKMACEIFGEQRVDVSLISQNKFDVTIHFPEVTIKNSRGVSHKIKDLFVRLICRRSDYDTTSSSKIVRKMGMAVGISGSRATASISEQRATYSHSHLSLGTDYGNFSSFCLGASNFRILIENLRLEPTETNWELILHSIENYISWESLEGGPHCLIQNIGSYPSSRRDITDYKKAALELLKNIPSNAWEWSGESLRLIADHPDLYDYFDENSQIKDFIKDNTRKARVDQLNSSYKNHVLPFKGKNIQIKFYDEKAENEEQSSHINKRLVNTFIKEINDHSAKFFKNYEYEQLKKRKAQVIEEIRAI